MGAARCVGVCGGDGRFSLSEGEIDRKYYMHKSRRKLRKEYKVMEGVQNLPPPLQGEFMKTLEQMQIKDSLM